MNRFISAEGPRRSLSHSASRAHAAPSSGGRARVNTAAEKSLPVQRLSALQKLADERPVAPAPAAETAVMRGAVPQPARNAPIQMAGHPEDICVTSDWIVKRADATELQQYQAGEVPPTAPGFGGPFYTATAAIGFLTNAGQALSGAQTLKINTMAGPMAQGGKGFIILENATRGLNAPVLRDLKMGTATADDADQERHGVTGLSKEFKLARHAVMDIASGSAARGFRDEDAWKQDKTGDNLAALNTTLEGADVMALLMIDDQIDQIAVWVTTSPVIYVGMSILLVVSGGTGKAVAIDFEHPIRRNEPSFDMHRAGLLLGLETLKKMVGRQLTAKGMMNATGEGNILIGNDDL